MIIEGKFNKNETLFEDSVYYYCKKCGCAGLYSLYMINAMKCPQHLLCVHCGEMLDG